MWVVAYLTFIIIFLRIKKKINFILCNFLVQTLKKILFKLSFFKNRYLGDGTFVFTFYIVNLPLGKFGPHPGGSYRGRGGLSFFVEGKGR